MMLQKEQQKEQSTRDLNTKVKDFGLNSYESKLWIALLSRGVSTAGELSDIAGVPRSRSYDVLESLEKKGFIIVKLGKPIRYVAVPPDHALEHVKKTIQENAVSQTKLLDELQGSSILNELISLHNTGVELIDPSELSGVVKGRKNLYNHLQDRIGEAQQEVIILTTSNGITRKAQALKNSVRKASERKVRVRIAAPNATSQRADLELFTKFADLRDTSIKGRFCIIDGKEVTFMVLDDDKTHPNYDFGVWVKSELFAKMLKSFFDECWKDMKPVKN